MTTTLKISGDNLLGGFDSELTSANPMIVAAAISGVPWYRVTSSAATKIIGKSPLGSPATTHFGFAFRKTGNPASSQVFLHPFTSGGATSFRLRLSSTGTIILDGAVTNTLDTSAVLANDTTYAIVGQISATAATITIYAADGVTVIDTITATNTFGLVDNWRMGQIGGSPAIPDWYFRMLLVGDTAVTPASVLATPAALGTPRRAVIGDSNTGENGAGPTHYFDAFTAAGISTRDIYWWGVGGKRIAAADLTGKNAANNVADAQAWFGTIDTWVIALGTNDRPQTDATINADIDTMLAAIGTGPKVIWIGLTSKATASADDVRVNNLVKAKLTARGNAAFADWDAHIRAIDGGANPSPYWLTTDTTHMTPLGYQERAAFYAAQLASPAATGTTVQTMPALTSQAVGAATPPAYQGNVVAALPGLSQAVAGGTVPPLVAGSVVSTLSALTSALTGAAVAPVVQGTAASILPALSGASDGTTTPPAQAGTVSSNLPALTAVASGQAVPPGWAGTMGSVMPALSSTVSGGVSAPQYVGQIAVTLPSLTATVVGGAGVQDDSVGAVVVVFPALVASVFGDVGGAAAIFVPEVRTLTGVEVHHTLVAAAALRTLEDA